MEKFSHHLLFYSKIKSKDDWNTGCDTGQISCNYDLPSFFLGWDKDLPLGWANRDRYGYIKKNIQTNKTNRESDYRAHFISVPM